MTQLDKSARTKRPSLDYASDYTEEVRLFPGRTILVVVDMQYASGSRTDGQGKLLAKQGAEHLGAERFDRIERIVVPNLQRLLSFFRSNDLPVLYLVTGAARSDGSDMARHLRRMAIARGNFIGTRTHEILDELKPDAYDLVLRKTTVSGFASTGLEAAVRAMGIDSLVFSGISTNQCVGLTAMDAADRGFRCVIVEDCSGATKQSYHDAALINFQRFMGRVASSSEIVAELTERVHKRPRSAVK